MGAAMAAAFHEFCHYQALRLCGVQIAGFSVGVNGAVLATAPMERRQEFICALAGPVGSFLLLGLHRWMPVTAVCAGLQGAFNLLPVFPMDGGRVMRCVFGEGIALWAEKMTMILLACAGIYGSVFLKLGCLPLIGAALIILKTAFRKIPCKDGPLGVQ